MTSLHCTKSRCILLSLEGGTGVLCSCVLGQPSQYALRWGLFDAVSEDGTMALSQEMISHAELVWPYAFECPSYGI